MRQLLCLLVSYWPQAHPKKASVMPVTLEPLPANRSMARVTDLAPNLAFCSLVVALNPSGAVCTSVKWG